MSFGIVEFFFIAIVLISPKTDNIAGIVSDISLYLPQHLNQCVEHVINVK